jgi:hypothetical protein
MNFFYQGTHMKNKHLMNIFALGFGVSAITTSIEAASGDLSGTAVFGIQSQEIALLVCNADNVSIENIHRMIGNRNSRDKKLVKSSTDKMTHL